MSREEEEFQGDSSAPQKEQPVSVQEEEEEGDLILGAEDVAEEINDVNTMEGEEEDEGDGDEEMGEGQDDEEDMMNQGGEDFVDDSVQGFFDHTGPVYSVALHPVQPHVAVSGGGDDKAFLWRIDDGTKICDLTAHQDSVISVSFSADGQYVCSAGMDGKINVSLSVSGQHVITLEGPDEFTWCNWHPRGNVLLAGGADGTVWMWSVPKGEIMHVFSGHAGPVNAGSFSPDGKLIVTCSDDCSVIVWDPKTASILHKFSSDDGRFHSGPVTTLAINFDNQLVLTGSQDASARLIHIGNGKIIGKLESHSESVEAVAFCQAMPLMVTGDVDGTIHIWDTAAMRVRHSVKHDDAITSLKFLPNTPLLLSSSADRSIRLWDARTGECLKHWKGHQDTVLDIQATADQRYILSGADDNCCLLFSI